MGNGSDGLFVSMLGGVLSSVLNLALGISASSFSGRTEGRRLITSVPGRVALSLGSGRDRGLDVSGTMRVILSRCSAPRAERALLEKMVKLEPSAGSDDFAAVLTGLRGRRLVGCCRNNLVNLGNGEFKENCGGISQLRGATGVRVGWSTGVGLGEICRKCVTRPLAFRC